MRSATRALPAVFLALAILVAAGCGGTTSTSSRSTPSAKSSPGGKLDPAVAMPAGFPSNFPIYPGARLTQAGNFTSNGKTTWALEWETLDTVDKVQAFYADKLNKDPWTISFSGSSNGQYSAVFAPKKNSNAGGILGVSSTFGVTKISLALVPG